MRHPDVSPRDYLVAESPAMRAVVDSLAALADSDGPALVCGEHGTGRELVARVLHQASPRRAGRFVAVRPTFDHGAGDASSGDLDDGERAKRVLRAAQGGTLLIKDVCEVAASGQRALRRAIRPTEGARERRPDSSGEVFDVRVVGTGDLDLERAVAARLLAPELYEQLNKRRIDVPPLRDRGADIPALVDRWVRRYADEVGRGRLTISTRAHERLVKYPWPGNVAELKNLCRRLVLATSGSRIEAGDVDLVLPVVAERVPMEELSLEEVVKAKLAGFLDRMDGYPVHDLYDKVMARVERPLFDLVLAKTGGNQLKAAAMLGLNRNTLRKKLDLLGVARRTKGRDERALDD